MYKALSPGAIGVKAPNVDEAIQAAQTGGFGGVEYNAKEIAELIDSIGLEAVRRKFDSAGIKPAAFGMPVEFRGDEATWRSGLADLPRLARAAGAIGGGRTATWIMPCSNERNFDQNRRFHIERFAPIAEILGEYGCSLGLEFIGPKTLRDSQRFPFIYTLEAMLEMGADIGGNVGVLLDCWHWHTSCGTLDELYALKANQVVYVHVNDAPIGVAMDDHRDNVRGLPGETGVIDIGGFLRALNAIGYTGPVTPEPFADLTHLPNDKERLELVGQSMDKVFGMC